MSQVIISGVLATNVANGATFAVSYPTGVDGGYFAGVVGHVLVIDQTSLTIPTGFTASFGASTVTLTNTTGRTLTAGSPFRLQLETIGDRSYVDEITGNKPLPEIAVTVPNLVTVTLGAPAAASANAIATSQSVTVGTTPNAVINGALASGGVATLDGAGGRNVVAAWTGTAVVTVRGFDIYGNALTESSGSGTSFTGVKAFARVTQVSFSADVTSATVGTGTVLGLPVFLNGAGYVVRELVDGAIPGTGGTFVAGLRNAASTATTADVRGTYAPNQAPNASRAYQLLLLAPNAGYRGIAQFAS